MRIWEMPLVGWILPGLLVVLWLWFTGTGRGSPRLFAAVSLVLVVLCFPAGTLAGRDQGGLDCTPADPCPSLGGMFWWVNGILGLLTFGLLNLATLVVGAVRGTSPAP